MKQPFIFRLPANESEFRKAIDHINTHMFEVYGARPNPHETPEHLFLVTHGKNIVSTLGIDFGKENKKLTFEKTFAFTEKDLPFAYKRPETIFYSRWTTKMDNFGIVVWCLASQYAMRKGFKYSSAIGKPLVYQLMREYGCSWCHVSNAKPNAENISPYDRAYYFTQPQPIPSIGVIEKQVIRMWLTTKQLIDTGTLIVQA